MITLYVYTKYGTDIIQAKTKEKAIEKALMFANDFWTSPVEITKKEFLKLCQPDGFNRCDTYVDPGDDRNYIELYKH